MSDLIYPDADERAMYALIAHGILSPVDAAALCPICGPLSSCPAHTSQCVPGDADVPAKPTPAEIEDAQVSEMITWFRDRRHHDRRDFETEKACRDLLGAIKAAGLITQS